MWLCNMPESCPYAFRHNNYFVPVCFGQQSTTRGHGRDVPQHAGVVDVSIALSGQCGVVKVTVRACKRAMTTERGLDDFGSWREPSLVLACVLGVLWKTSYSICSLVIFNRRCLLYWALYFQLEKPIYYWFNLQFIISVGKSGHIWNVLTLTQRRLHIFVPLIHVAVSQSNCRVSSLAFRPMLCCTDPVATG